ncbi:FMRFamide receptor-like protein [Plakobranchus ocellatus]|uniref:FMRFamide receptor-like protein n=1 Tax=Plakobranchus ocellatus TaxID=259542 RepID=A0AAV4B500_9GAST|nr:FMRFamide receptor-like protein [Plakobranchus ocellatus]
MGHTNLETPSITLKRGCSNISTCNLSKGPLFGKDLELLCMASSSGNETSLMEATAAPSFAAGKPDVWYWRVGLFAGAGSGICCAGVVSNIIAIIVLFNFRKKSSAPFLLISLATFEILFLLSYLILENIALLSWGGLISASYANNIKRVYSILYPLPHILQTCLAYLVVVITLERYIVVAWPFKAHTLCSLRSARIAVTCVMIYSILYHIPTYTAFTYRKVWQNDTGVWENDFVRTDFGRSNFYNVAFIKYMHLIFNFGIPCILLLISNTLLVVALRRSVFSATADQIRAARETRLTVMVFSITVIFFVVQLMEGIALGMLAGLSKYEEAPVPVNRFSAVADTLMLLNSATNFVIYCATGRQFRETFILLFCHVCSRRAVKGKARNQNNGISTALARMKQKNITAHIQREVQLQDKESPSPAQQRSSGLIISSVSGMKTTSLTSPGPT